MLDQLLGSRTRTGILTALVLDGRRLRLLELQREVGTSVSSVQQELARLEQIGLVRSERIEGSRYLSAEANHPLTAPLRDLLAAGAALGGAVAVDLPAERVHPAVRPALGEIVSACQRHGVLSAALVGSSTQPELRERPNDIDLLVRFEPGLTGYADRYFGLLTELEGATGMPVEIIEEDAITNELLASEFARTRVVLYEAA
jgi:predicted nucleotidyltransferase